MATAFITAARQRLMKSSEPDNEDDLGFERIPEKDDRGIELEMNIRYNLRGCVVFWFVISANRTTVETQSWAQGLETKKSNCY